MYTLDPLRTIRILVLVFARATRSLRFRADTFFAKR